MHPGFAALGALFIVFAQPSASAQPSQRPFHHPPAGQHLRVVAVRFAFDHGQQATASGPRPRHQLTGVTGIGPDHPQSGKPTVPRQLYLPVHLLGLAPLLGCVGAVAGDVKLQDDGVMDHPVNRRSGGHGVGDLLDDGTPRLSAMCHHAL